MTKQEFDAIKWRSGMWITIGNIRTEVIQIDFSDRTIAFEDEHGLVWVNSEYVTLNNRS